MSRQNFSVRRIRRKWPCADKVTRRALVLTAAIALLLGFAPAASARTPRGGPPDFQGKVASGSSSRNRAKPSFLRTDKVPLPRSRPAEAPARPAPAIEKSSEAQKPEPPTTPREAAPPSACRLALTDSIAIAPSIPDITGPGSCLGEDLVRLEAIVLPGGARVALKPAATLRCEMASAVAAWMRDDIVPFVAGMNATPTALDNFDSFDCRGRNRVVGAKMSEHGRANALDLRGITLSTGANLALTDRATPREARERVLQSVCGRFTTVLGPGSDGYHEDHIHLDLTMRRSGYRICQWQIDEAMPVIAPMLPAPRPEEAAPRMEVEKAAQQRPKE